MKTIKNVLSGILLVVLLVIVGKAVFDADIPQVVINPARATAQPVLIFATSTPALATVEIAQPTPTEIPYVPLPLPPNPNDAAELQAVTVALKNSQRVAGACIQAAVDALASGKPQPDCEGVFLQVQELDARRLELEGR